MELDEEESSTSGNPGSSCDCQCCVNPGIPYQPANVSESKTVHSHFCKEIQHGQLKSYSRKIQPNWYKQYPWISVCTSKYKIFCASCCGAKQQGLLTFTRHKIRHLLIKALVAGIRQSNDAMITNKVRCIERLWKS